MLLRLLVLFALVINVAASVRLTLPPTIYAVPGVEMSVYFANTILIESNKAADYRFRCECPIGTADASRWTLNAKDKQSGAYPFKLTVLDQHGKAVQAATNQLHVSRKNTGKGESIRLLIMGDSLTHATQYPNEIARLLSGPGNPRWQMLGTHKPTRAKNGVVHEGYGGWSWVRFRTKFEPTRPFPGKTNSSPFVFPDKDNPQNGKTDVARYFATHCGGSKPDFMVIMLGINDCFSAKPDSPKSIDVKVDWMFREADLLLADIRKAAPNAQIGICLTTPGNSRDAAFVANYRQRYTRWGWRRIQHRLVERQIEHFHGKKNIHLIPTNLNLDTTAGYPANNGVHPNTEGYNQIGATIYSWIKSRL